MLPEIERILEADDTAKEKVKSASTEAESIRLGAAQEVDAIVDGSGRDLRASLTAERDRVLGEARQQAAEILQEADRYIQGLRERKEALIDPLVVRLLEKVLRP